MSYSPVMMPVYNPRGLQRALKALANADAAPFHWLADGDSVTEGTGVGTGNSKDGVGYIDKRYVRRAAALLQQRWTTAGKGGVGWVNAGSNVVSSGATSGSAYWAFTGGTAGSLTNSGGWFGGRGRNFGIDETATFTWTGTGVTFYTGNNAASYVTNGGSFTYSVDGGAATTFTYVASGGPISATASGLTSGTHTITFTPAAGKKLWLGGIVAFDGDEANGVRLWENARFGITSTQAVSALSTGATVLTPHLVSIFLGLNGATGAQYTTDILALINAVKTAFPGTSGVSSPSFLLIAPYEQSSSVLTTSHDQGQRLKAICDADPLNVAYLPLFDRFSGTGQDSFNAGLMVNDYLHPTNQGHYRIAKAIVAAIEAAA